MQDKGKKIEKELLFSGGAGSIGFMMGYSQAILEIVGKEELKKFKLGGVSAGNAAALLLHLVLYEEDENINLRYYSDLLINNFFKKENQKYFGLFQAENSIKIIAETVWEKTTNKSGKIPDINGIFHTPVTRVSGFFKLKKEIHDKFDNLDDLEYALQSSAQIPFVTSFGIFRKKGDKKCIDGGITGCIPYKNEKSQKIFINVMPKIFNKAAQFFKKTPNLQTLNITENSDVKFPLDYWCWSEEFNENMFEKGYISGLKNFKQIQKIFNIKYTNQSQNSKIQQNLNLKKLSLQQKNLIKQKAY